MRYGFRVVVLFAVQVIFVVVVLLAQTGNSGSIEGTVLDPSGKTVANATVEIINVVSGYSRTMNTAKDGSFRFTNVPFNPYHMTVMANGFANYFQDVEVRSAVSTKVDISLTIGTASTTVVVESSAEDLLENDPTFHTDVDRNAFERTPLESNSSAFTSLVTLRSPGVAADSNGLMHGLGDHAENSISLDGQPQTDQFSKVFSNQIPADSIQSMEVISGAPPADFGDKTSLVIKVTTRSGMGVTKPVGSVYTNYGSFGTVNAGFDLAYGGDKWGNFIALNGLNTSRFLDPPEFDVLHDKGNQENVFDRVDYQFSQADGLHFNFGFTRSWFQNPNTFDQQYHTCVAGFTCNPTGTTILNNVTRAPLGTTDQRSKIRTFNIAPTGDYLLSSNAVFTLGGWVRQDQYNYYPSGDPLNDLAPDLQVETASQSRKLTNAGARSDFSYVRGIHNVKVGILYQQTFLTEDDHFGIVDPTFNVPGTSTFSAILACYDLTRPTPAPSDGCANTTSTLYPFKGHTDVKELALYAIDNITWHNWAFNLGIRGDLYNGISSGSQAEPRLGISYNIKPTSTVLSVSYARIMETPFNENLVIASTGCGDPVIAAIVSPPGITCNLGALTPGFRNEFHAGFQQAFGKYLVVDAQYIWKYTHNGFDFGIVGATPITFPIEWHNAKIPGWMLRASVPDFHGLTALVVMSSVAARFYNPQVAGIAFYPAFNVFRIDHDEKYNQTTHVQYQPWKKGPWVGFNWRYDSGLVAGATPCSAPTATCFSSTSANDYPGVGPGGANIPAGYVALVNTITGLPLTADQQYQGGFTCNGVRTAPSPFGPALTSCPANEFGSLYIQVPGQGKENDDHNPQRIQPRSLFDTAVGHDNLFHGDRYKWSLRFTVVNLANKVALYNFLSTFSGTHYVTPRTETLELGFHF
ncbi:MAG TPA: TonB-dependent receptor [Candidatus Acidoferrum sp.]|nr:TonB-dependent receptor [Candidatus Acidoferrum sp.]